MATAAFLKSLSPQITDRVYTKQTKAALAEHAAFLPEAISMENLEKNREALKTVEYFFSTWGIEAFSEEMIQEYFPALKAVFYGAGSVQGFARPFLNKGVHVFSAWAANAIPVAEYTVAQIILANKGFYQSSRIYKTEQSSRPAQDFCNRLDGNFNSKIGLLGAGMIGKYVISLLKNYKFDVLVFDPFLSKEAAEKLGVRKAELKEVFAECAVVSNHLANNEKTKGMLDYSLFSLMRDNAVFINTGRGAQVVEDDLVKAMQEKPERTAILDVTWPEPVQVGHPFYTLDNVILTPHIAGSMNQEVARMGEYMLEEFVAFSEGKPTRFDVSLEMLETMA